MPGYKLWGYHIAQNRQNNPYTKKAYVIVIGNKNQAMQVNEMQYNKVKYYEENKAVKKNKKLKSMKVLNRWPENSHA